MKVEKSYPNPNGYKVKVLDAERSWGESRLLHAIRRVTVTVTILSTVFYILDSQRKDKAYHKAKRKDSGSGNKYMISVMANKWQITLRSAFESKI